MLEAAPKLVLDDPKVAQKMLVLALQFSRSEGALRLLQNRREDGAAEISWLEEGPNPSTRARSIVTTHQCTNRCVSDGSNVCRPTNEKALLRKEVIQPHLPVRLPCYDFTPVTNPTFDGSFPQGVRPPASAVADFRGVTGGVYKARERIHPGVLIQDY